MTLRPPKALAARTKLPDNPLNAALEREVLEEKVATYVRLVKRLEAALAALEAHDAARSDLPLTAIPPASRASLREGGLAGPPGPAKGRPEDRLCAFALASLRSEGNSSKASDMTNQEARSGAATTGTQETRERLLAEAGEALWYVTIQRDLCGFRRHDLFYRDMNGPAAVRHRMGLVRSR